MSRVVGLAHVGLRIADAERSGSFYRRFGFDWTRRDRSARVHVLLHPVGIELNLIEKADRQRPNVLMDDCRRCPGYTHIALQVDDVLLIARQLASDGVRITEGPVRFGDGSTSVFVRDPDGNVLELCQPEADDHAPPP